MNVSHLSLESRKTEVFERTKTSKQGTYYVSLLGVVLIDNLSTATTETTDYAIRFRIRFRCLSEFQYT